ncbi:MAG: cobaltochelatase subunit CobN [Halopseudomonas sp.]
MVRFLMLLALLTPWLAIPVQAAQLFAVVSERSAAEWSAAARQFNRSHPDHRLIARTPQQLLIADASQLEQWLVQSEVVFAGGVFGEAVATLNSVSAPATQTRIAVHSDRALLPWVRLHGQTVFDPVPVELIDSWRNPPTEQPLSDWLAQQLQLHPVQGRWLKFKSLWNHRGVENLSALICELLRPYDRSIAAATVVPRASVRIWFDGNWYDTKAANNMLQPQRPTLFILDHNKADRRGDWDLVEQLCQQRSLQCIAVLSAWGTPTEAAINWMRQQLPASTPQLLLSLQDFVLGGGEQRQAVTEALKLWKVPVIKGVRLWEQTPSQWQLSLAGLPVESVHYRIAMPELQGISQPLVLAALSAPQQDNLTGIELRISQPIPSQMELLQLRIQRWLALQTQANADKRVAIIYYNHPPGRHNIGADNLNVPQSLWQILQALKQAGYSTGPLPDTAEAFLDQIQQQGVNLPEDAGALAKLSTQAATMDAERYQTYFDSLPATLRAEMQQGPLGYLDAYLQRALQAGEIELARQQLSNSAGNIRHLLEGVDHPARERALALFDQLVDGYQNCITGQLCQQVTLPLLQALLALQIEGIRGWGEAPGRVMTWLNRLLIPGLQFGNVFIGPQPPRGWELNEELLHANTSFPPTHQYLAFYHYLRHQFGADALIHLGRHSTYEFLPRHQTGLSEDDYATHLIGELPSIYPYIVDGVGEGIQAKRRGAAVMIDHLTPPLVATPLYDDLLELRQLIETYEAALASNEMPLQRQSVQQIRQRIDQLNLRQELEASMAAELAVRGVGFDQVDDQLLIHEVGHYLTQLQEKFMPLGLHSFGQQWSDEAIATQLQSISTDPLQQDKWREPLRQSPRLEMTALLDALDGKFVAPGKGNDPIRSPDSLPTGRNFFALDGSLLPSKLGYQQGLELAAQARAQLEDTANGSASSSAGRQAIVLWASDTVRDEGAMIGFGLDMLSIEPVWSSRGILKTMRRIPTAKLIDAGAPQRQRHDVVFTTSGLFRDLYGQQLIWLDRAVLMALDASSHTIERDYPALTLALSQALAPLNSLRQPGDEPLARNQVARNWVNDTLMLLANGLDTESAARQSRQRIFGAAPGAYGAGVNRAVERSGSWQQRSEVAEIYRNRMGYAYGIDQQGEPAHASFNQVLATVEHTYLGRASNLYGLIDNNDAFDFLGGLNMAVEQLRDGRAPESWVIEHADRNSAQIKPLAETMLQEFRGRYLNPAWIKPLMDQGYAGARTMGSEFLEYLWGWQVTSPGLIDDWVWDEVKRVYVDDGLELGLDQFLRQQHNAHVYSNMMAIMLVAADKGFWDTDEATRRDLAQQFVELILANGLPGSGHTHPDHPLYAAIQPYLEAQQQQALAQLLQASRLPEQPQSEQPSRITELQPQPASQSEAQALDFGWRGFAAALALLFVVGLYRGRRA